MLRRLGHDVCQLGDGRVLLERLLADPPDFVFNFAEGTGVSRSREARVPAVLEMLGIPFTGSDPLTMAATLDKECAKRLAASAGVAVPASLTAWPGQPLAPAALASLSFPVIVKPAWEGSSKGIRQHCLVQRPQELDEVVGHLCRRQRQPVLVEEFIAGDELTVGLLGNEPPRILGIMGIRPRQATAHFVYSLEIKREYQRLVHYDCPAPLSAAATAAVDQAARAVFGVLGCRDVARIDFRLRDGIPYFLEMNPLPGLHPEDSDLVIMARLLGISHAQLVEDILNAALARTKRMKDEG